MQLPFNLHVHCSKKLKEHVFLLDMARGQLNLSDNDVVGSAAEGVVKQFHFSLVLIELNNEAPEWQQ